MVARNMLRAHLLALQDEFDHWLVQVNDLEAEGLYDEALARLDGYFAVNSHRDQDQWLARAIALQKAGMLLQAARGGDATRYGAVERVCVEWERLGFDSLWHRWFEASIRAEALVALGREREALLLVENALDERKPEFLADAIPLLALLGALSEKLQEPVHERFRPLARAVAKRYRVALPEAETLAQSLVKLREITRELAPKGPEEWKNEPAEAW